MKAHFLPLMWLREKYGGDDSCFLVFFLSPGKDLQPGLPEEIGATFSPSSSYVTASA